MLRFDDSLGIPANEILIMGMPGILGLNFPETLSLIEPFVRPSLRVLSQRWSSLRGDTGMKMDLNCLLRRVSLSTDVVQVVRV